MRDRAELTMLFRGRLGLPDDVKLVTEEFREGWSVGRSRDLRWLDRTIRKRGWTLTWIAEASLRGVGETSEEAIANTLNLLVA